MNLLELIKKRCSVRKYAPTPVEKEKIDYILEAARLAPSAVNRQSWYFLLVTEQAGCEKIYKCYSREWIQTAKCFIVICGDHAQSWKRGYDDKDHVDVDAAIATEHICLAAAEQGLGTCWICNFDAVHFRELFELPDSVEPIAIVPIGYPDPADTFETNTKKRKELQEVLKKESF